MGSRVERGTKRQAGNWIALHGHDCFGRNNDFGRAAQIAVPKPDASDEIGVASWGGPGAPQFFDIPDEYLACKK